MKFIHQIWFRATLLCIALIAFIVGWRNLHPTEMNEKQLSEPQHSTRSHMRSAKPPIVHRPRFVGTNDMSPEEQIEEYLKSPDAKREVEICVLMRRFARKNPQFVAEHLMKLQVHYGYKCEIAEEILRNWKDSKQALQWADENFHGLNRGEFIGLALGTAARTSPEEAIQYWERMSGGAKIREDALCAIADGWFQSDRSGLLAYVQNLTDAKLAATVMNKITLSWIGSDIPGAIKYLEESSGDASLNYLAGVVSAIRIGNESPTDVLAWAETLKGSAGANARKAAYETWARQSPIDALACLSSADLQTRSEIAPSIAATWAETNPRATMEWIDRLPDDAAKTEVVSKTMEVITRNDTIHASEWLGTLPEGTTRDAGILVLLRYEARKDPSNLLPWAEAIHDPSLREKEVKRVLQLQSKLQEK